MRGLKKRAFGGLLFLIIVLSASLLLAAGTFNYWQAWVFLAVFSLGTLAITIYLMQNDPSLLERRVNAGPGAEQERSQKIIQVLASIAFVAVLVVPALDRRFAWSAVPVPVVAVGDVLVALGLFIVFLVYRENTFASATIGVEANQKVVATGPYALVRHPMYAGALIMLFGVPLALGSWWGLLAVLPITLIIVWRLSDEEVFLVRNLSGYVDYRSRVGYRLIPFVW